MRNKAGRRDLMINAAWACFIRNGYTKTALGDVAQEAGISRTLIYQEFANKEELFATLIAEKLNEQFEAAKAELESKVEIRERLYRVIDTWTMQTREYLESSPFQDELFAAAYKLFPKLESVHRERSIALLTPFTGDPESADVLRMSLKGLEADRPAAPLLRARVRVLIERYRLAN